MVFVRISTSHGKPQVIEVKSLERRDVLEAARLALGDAYVASHADSLVFSPVRPTAKTFHALPPGAFMGSYAYESSHLDSSEGLKAIKTAIPPSVRVHLSIDHPIHKAEGGPSVREMRDGTSPNTSRIRAYLAKLTVVRIDVHNGAGNGHQAAAVTAMRWLRANGFQGELVVCSENPSVHGRIAKLLAVNPVAPYTTRRFEHGSLGRIMLCGPDADAPAVPLVICAANDVAGVLGTQPAQMHAVARVSTQPTDMVAGGMEFTTLLGCDASLTPQGQDDGILHHGCLPIARKQALQAFTPQQADIVLQLERAAKDSKLHWTCVYHGDFDSSFGGRTPYETVELLSGGLRTANFDRPAVLLLPSVPNPPPPNTLVVVDEASAKLALQSIVQAKPGDIVLIGFRGVQPEAFQYMFNASSLPSAGEGPNAYGPMQEVGPHLQCGRYWHKSLRVPAAVRGFAAPNHTHTEAVIALTDRSIDHPRAERALAKYYAACARGEMREFYTACSDVYLARQDKLAAAVLQIAQRDPPTNGREMVDAHRKNIAASVVHAKTRNDLIMLLDEIDSLVLSAEADDLSPKQRVIAEADVRETLLLVFPKALNLASEMISKISFSEATEGLKACLHLLELLEPLDPALVHQLNDILRNIKNRIDGLLVMDAGYIEVPLWLAILERLGVAPDAIDAHLGVWQEAFSMVKPTQTYARPRLEKAIANLRRLGSAPDELIASLEAAAVQLS